MTGGRNRQDGVILMNVMVVLALSSAVLLAMLQLSDLGIARSQQFSDAAQGLAIMDGAEITAIAALRDDLRLSPEADHPGEAWAAVAQSDIAIEGGRFSVAIADATGKFNLTNLSQAAPQDAAFLIRILDALPLPEAARLQLLARLANPAPLSGLSDLLGSGLTPADVDVLATLLTVLPKPTAINLNTMPDTMFAVLAANPVQARLLQGLRARKGQLALSDFLDAGLVAPVRVSVTSSYFALTTRVSLGNVTLARESLLQRRITPEGAAAMVIARRPVE